jgi:hypothetical protein
MRPLRTLLGSAFATFVVASLVSWGACDPFLLRGEGETAGDASTQGDAGDGAATDSEAGSTSACGIDDPWVTYDGVHNEILAQCSPGGESVNLLSDATNCGYCGHSCQGDFCQNGRCRPRGEGSAPAGGLVVPVVATADRAFFLTTGQKGEPPMTLYSFTADRIGAAWTGNSTLPLDAFSANHDSIFFNVVSSSILRHPLSDSTPSNTTTLQATQTAGRWSAASPTYVVYSDYNPSQGAMGIYLRIIDSDAGPPAALAQTGLVAPAEMVVTLDDRVYWLDSPWRVGSTRTGALDMWTRATGRVRFASGFGLPSSLAHAGNVVVFADVQSGIVYQAQNGSIAAEPVAILNDDGLVGDPLPVDGARIAVAPPHLYWVRKVANGSSATYSLMRRLLCGGPEITLVANEPQMSGLLLTASRIYWSLGPTLHSIAR